ncbi:MAG: 2-hydroxyacyl-CoA dehydratase family protein [Dehalococcoidales bacterium]|nr:2-hydroxyacyl-CoA dehydratase family protein [Dehalococcoidales bacterium]
MMEQKKKKAINRLQTMYPLRANIDKMYERGVEASKTGKPTAWCMVNWWEADPILKAMDVEVVYPENYGAVCAAFGTAPAYLDRSDADGFPTHMCGYARNCIGYTSRMTELGQIPPEAPMGGMAKPFLLLCSGALCDARYKWFQALGRYLDAPVWTVEIPHIGVAESQDPATRAQVIKFMVKELGEFVKFMERMLNKKMDWDKLAEVTDDLIKVNRLWHEINELRKARPCPMHSRDFWSCMNASLYPAGDPKESLKLYQDMYTEVKDRVDKKIGAVANEKYRMLFAELPPWHDLKIFDELADRGWNFVVESWAYHPAKPIDTTKVSNPLERIAAETYHWLTGYFDEAYKAKEYMGYFAYPYLEWARTYQCDGGLLHPLLTCRTATNHLMLIQDRLLNKLKVPTLVAEGDIVDLKLFNHAETMRKAETLEEMMDHYKQKRRDEGLEW